MDGDANAEASGAETNAALGGITDSNADVAADAEGDSNANEPPKELLLVRNLNLHRKPLTLTKFVHGLRLQ